MKVLVFFKKAGLTCLFLLIFFELKALPSACYISPEQVRSYQLLLKMDFKACASSLRGNRVSNYQIKSLAVCLDAFLTCDKKKYETGRKLSVVWLDSISKTPEDEEKLFVKAQVKLHWAFLSYTYGERITSAMEIRQAYGLLKENARKYPGHKPTLLYFGFFNAFLSEISENYRWIANAVGLHSSLSLGNEMISKSENCSLYLDLEKNIILLLRKPQTASQQQILTHVCEYLMMYYGNNDLVRFIVTFHYLKNKKNEEALSVINSFDHITMPMIIYQKAMSSYYNLETDTAIHYFKKFDKLNKSNSFKKDTGLRLGYLSFLNGDTVSASKFIINVKKQGNSALYTDKNAEKLASAPMPELVLLKARILYDAGNWEKSKIYLTQYQPQHILQRTELLYRMGKIEAELGDLTKARKYYQDCITVCPPEGIYFGPFACLDVAELLLHDSKKESEFYLAKSKEFTGFEFAQTFNLKYQELTKLLK